jgi:adenosylhomocysteine nucleosidase
VVIRTLSDKADGLAHDTYENMADLAADNSCRIVMEMLKSSKAIENND